MSIRSLSEPIRKGWPVIGMVAFGAAAVLLYFHRQDPNVESLASSGPASPSPASPSPASPSPASQNLVSSEGACENCDEFRQSLYSDTLYPGNLEFKADGADGIKWEPTLEAALARAQKENKPLFVQFAAKFDGRANSPFC